jgi:hypothetical protein
MPLTACALALALAGTASAGSSTFDPGSQRETHLISQTFNGSWPDGPSQHPAFSQDRQYASVAAFDSDADNLVPSDTNGTTDVFAVYRAQPYSLAGEPWRINSTELVSRGLNGAPRAQRVPMYTAPFAGAGGESLSPSSRQRAGDEQLTPTMSGAVSASLTGAANCSNE